MNALSELFSTAAAQRIGWALIHFLWQGAAVAMVLAVTLALLRNRSPQARWIACCAALAIMAALPVVTVALVSVDGPPAPVAAEAPAEPPAGDAAMSPLPMAPQPAPPGVQDPIVAGPPPAPGPSDAPPAVAESPAAPWAERARRAIHPVLPWAILVWLVGVVGLSVWHLGGWVLLARARRGGIPPDGAGIREAFEALRRRLAVRRPVRLLESVRVAVPAVVGWLRPVVLLPVGAMTGLTPRQLEAVLAHELAHVRRCDGLVRLLQAAVETLLFYHPAVWWVSARIRAESEHCCDDLAVGATGDRPTYARALARVAELGRRRPHLAAAATGGRLLPRIRRVLGLAQAPARTATGWITGAVLLTALAAAALVIYGCGAGAPQATQPGEARRLGPRQILRISVLDLFEEGKEAVFERQVSDGGAISLPLLEKRLKVQGLSQDDVHRAIVKAYAEAKILKNPSVAVMILSAKAAPPATQPAGTKTPWSDPVNALRARLTCRKRTFVVGDPIDVTVELQCFGEKDYDFPDRPLRGCQLFPYLYVRVGTETKRISLDIKNRVHILKGQTFARQIRLSKWFDMARPGRYVVRAGHANYLVRDIGDWTGSVFSPWLEIVINAATQAATQGATYRATAFLRVHPPVKRTERLRPEAVVRKAQQEASRSLVSDAVMRRAIQSLKQTGWIERHCGQGMDPVRELRAVIRVKPVPETNLIALSMDGHDPGETAKIANAVAQAAVDHSATPQVRDLQNESDRLQSERDRLAKQTAGLAAPRTAEERARAQQLATRLRDVDKRLLALRLQLKTTRGRLTVAAPASVPTRRIRSAPATQRFTKAEVLILVNAQGLSIPANEGVAITLVDPGKIEALASFFPQLGSRRVSHRAAGWMAGLVVKFHKAGGQVLRATASANDALTVWSEGKGDWPVRGNLKAFVQTLMKEHAATQPTTQPAGRDDEVKRLIVDLARDDTRWAAVRRLGDLKDARAVKPLCDLLGSVGTADNWTLVIAALDKIGDRGALPALAEVVRKPPWRGSRGGPGPEGEEPMPSSTSIARDVQEAAVRAMARLDHGAAQRLLVERLDRSRYGGKEAEFAARMLGALGDRDAIKPLIAMFKVLRPGEGGAARAAVVALLRLDHNAARPVLVRLVMGETAEARAWGGVAAGGLAQLGDNRAVDVLIAALKTAQADGTRKAAARYLGEVGKPRAVKPLIAALTDKDVGVRCLAAYSLGQLRDPQAVPALTSALEDPAPGVRKAAAKALERIRQLAAATRPAEEWGKPNGGVQARLRADKATWAGGQTPTFRADIRNTGKGTYSVAQAQQLCELALDGTRYRWVGDIAVRSSALPPGREYKDIPVVLTDNWRTKEGNKPLKLTPGRHTLRVMFFCDGGSSQRNLVVETNAVEFEVSDPAQPATQPGAAALAIIMPATQPAKARRVELRVTARTIRDQKIHDIQITQKDIRAYDWTTHTIHLRPGVVRSLLNPRFWTGRFEVVVDGRTVYRGGLDSVLRSVVAKGPIIHVGPTGGQFQPKDAVRIYAPLPAGQPDPRNDKALRKALEDLGLLKNGQDSASTATAPARAEADNGAGTQPAAPDPDASATLPSPGDGAWSKTVDGLRMRLVGPAAPVGVNETFVLRMLIQNVSDKPIGIRRPLFLSVIRDPAEHPGNREEARWSGCVITATWPHRVKRRWHWHSSTRQTRVHPSILQPRATYTVIITVRGPGGDREKARLKDGPQRETVRFLYHGLAGKYPLTATYAVPRGTANVWCGTLVAAPVNVELVSPPTTQAAGSRLDFRIVPNAAGSSRRPVLPMFWRDTKEKLVPGALKELAAKGPDAARQRGDAFQWYEVAGEVNFPDAVIGKRRGRKYVLLATLAPHVMLAGKGKDAWGLAKVYVTPYGSGRPVVGFEFDDRGAKRFAAFTKANVGNAVAILVDGKVLAAPVLRTSLGSRGIIAGRFTDQQARNLVRALKAGMTPGLVNSDVLQMAATRVLADYIVAEGRKGAMPKAATQPEYLVKFIEGLKARYPRSVMTTPPEEKALAAGKFDDAGNARRLAAAAKRLEAAEAALPAVARFILKQQNDKALKGAKLEFARRLIEAIAADAARAAASRESAGLTKALNLTPAQQAKVKAWVKAWLEARKEDQAPNPAELVRFLNSILDDRQRALLKGIIESGTVPPTTQTGAATAPAPRP